MALRAKDIAEMLGVSTATVSLVLNNKPGVGDKKRQEIINKIRELGCGHMLREVPLNRGSIGFVIYKRGGRIIEESPFFAYILEGISGSIRKHGYGMGCVYLDSGMSAEEQKRQIAAYGFSGMIIFGTEMEREDLEAFKESGVPFSVLDNSFQESDVDAVAINNAQGMRKAAEHLREMGHTRVGYLKSRERINSFREREQLFFRQIRELGMSCRAEDIVEAGYCEQEIAQGVRAYLDRRKREELPTAFFAENDYIACAAMQAMQEAGFRIPEDFSVIGFDDRPVSRVVSPALTTINVPKDIFGPAAVELLISRIEGGRAQSMKITVGTELVKRESVIQKNN